MSVRRSAYWCVLAATAIAFFAASRLLPPVETGAFSNAVAAGFTNQLLPLVAILLIGTGGLGLVLWRTGAQGDAAAVSFAPAPYWRWQILAAAALSVVAVARLSVSTAPDDYFGVRVTLMDAGRRPYVDFEYAYGCLIAYLPYWLHAVGLTIRRALELTLALNVAAGVGAIAVVTERWIAQPAARVALFWSLVVCGVLVAPGPSLNYNFGRYALPFALAIVLVDRVRAGRWWGALATSIAANTLVYCISPEMGCAFTAAMTAWLATMARAARWPVLAAALCGLALSTAALVVFAWPMFTTLVAYAHSQVLQPVVPSPIMSLFVLAFLAATGSAVASALAAWGGRPDPAREAEWRACAALAGALLPAVVGRAWPTITLAYGFAPIVMLAGRRLAAGARWQGYAAAGLLIAFIGYSAWRQIGAGTSFGPPARGCAEAGCARPVVRASRRPAAYPPDLRARFPMPYDPLAIVPITAPLATEVGYFPGLALGNATTQADMARKMGELTRAGVYILPTDRRLARAGRDPGRGLAAYARASLYPLPLPVVRASLDPPREFAAQLYDLCQPLAQSGAITVCAARPAARPKSPAADSAD